MATRKRGKNNRPTVPKSPPTTILETTPQNEPVAKRHVWSGIKFIAGKGIDTAVEYVWLIVGGGIVTITTAIAAYVWSGQAEWLYPFLRYATAFFCGVATLIIIILFLTFVKQRKEKRIEKAKAEKFKSVEKGLLDYRVDFENARKKFPVCTGGIADDMGRISKTVGNMKFVFWAKINPRWGVKSASRTATKLAKHVKGMERHSKELSETITILDESISYLLKHTDTKELNDFRDWCERLLITTQGSCAALEVWYSSQHAAKGASQDLDTTLNHMIFVTEGIIETLKRSEIVWKRIIRNVDEIKKQPTQIHS